MPTVFLPCAIPGAGKSTYAKKFLANNPGVVYISSDGLRGVLGKDETDQSVSGEVFSIMRSMTRFFLKHETSIFVDATNYNRKARKDFVNIAREYGARVVAIHLDVPFAIALARNKGRARVVPDFVLERMRDGFEIPAPPEVDEVITIKD